MYEDRNTLYARTLIKITVDVNLNKKIKIDYFNINALSVNNRDRLLFIIIYSLFILTILSIANDAINFF